MEVEFGAEASAGTKAQDNSGSHGTSQRLRPEVCGIEKETEAESSGS
jgi:hypothetical protein